MPLSHPLTGWDEPHHPVLVTPAWYIIMLLSLCSQVDWVDWIRSGGTLTREEVVTCIGSDWISMCFYLPRSDKWFICSSPNCG